MFFPLKLLSGLIFIKFHVEPSVKGELKICLDGHVSVTKMVAITIDNEKKTNQKNKQKTNN